MASSLDPKHQNENLDAKIVVGLERVYEAFRVLLWEEARRHNLSPIQIQLLVFIQNHPPSMNTLSYLAREFSLTKATLSESIKTLDKKGLIIKETNPKDTRSHHLRLTEEGTAMASSAQSFATLLQQSVKQLSQARQTEFWEVLKSILTTLQHNGTISLQRMCFNCKWYQAKSEGHYCNLLKTKLEEQNIRIDCPEHSSLN